MTYILFILVLSSELQGIVRCFFGNLDIMRMALAESCTRDPDELGVIPQFLQVLCTAIAHTRAQSTDQLMDGICQRPFVSNTALDAFRYQFLIVILK